MISDPRTIVAELPRVLYIEPTNRCNSLCTECPRTFSLGLDGLRDMDFEGFRSIVDQFPLLERVVLHGLGEPLMVRDLPRMITYLKARGTYVLFNSNIILLGPKRAEALIDAGLDELRVSIDGVRPETYALIRGVDKLHVVTRNLGRFVETLRRRGAERPVVSLWFVAMRENLGELPGLVQLAHEAGIGEVYVQRLVYFGEGTAVEEQALFRRAQQRELAVIAEAEALAAGWGITIRAAGAATPLHSVAPAPSDRPWSACRRPFSLAYITANGNVLSCCFVPFTGRPYAGAVLGNVFAEDFASIWNGPRYRAFRAAFLSDRPAQWCEGCGSKWSL
jgi:MoaA/NifB/PqqE/SkfB family radical SAM enzyme